MNDILKNANDLMASSEQSLKKWEQFYSQPIYDRRLDIKPPQVSDPFNPQAMMQNQSPEPLAPHGASTRSVQMLPPEPEKSYWDNIKLLDHDDIFGEKTPEPGNSTSEEGMEWHDEGDGNQAINDPSAINFDTSKIAGGAMKFGTSLMQGLQGTDQSESESWAKTGQMAMSGAKAGMEIAGPWGAAAGGVIGGVAGLINKGADKRKRNRETREKNAVKSELAERNRLRDYEIKQAERDIQALSAMSKSQLNHF